MLISRTHPCQRLASRSCRLWQRRRWHWGIIQTGLKLHKGGERPGPRCTALSLVVALGALAQQRARTSRTGKTVAMGSIRRDGMAAPFKSRKVAVVGAGPAGVASCRFLAEAGHEPVIFEAGTEFGGIWAPRPTNPVVYQGLRTNIPTVSMQSFDLDFPLELPSFVHAEDLGRYIISYADHFGLRRYARFGARVTCAEPLKSEEEEEACGDASWRVQWMDERSLSEENFDAVVVATGHYDKPYLPEVPGQAGWMAAAPSPGVRTVKHSREYDVPEAYASRVVLIVGGRSSAVDIARELRDKARWVYVLSKGCMEVMTSGTCTFLPIGAEITNAGQICIGGKQVDGPPVDDIVMATGYCYMFPFLDAQQLGLDYGPLGRFVAPLYMHAMHIRRPSLCFVGLGLAVPCPLQLFEAEARFIAACITGGNALPTLAKRADWVATRKELVGERQQDMHFLSGGTWQHMRDLVRLSGLHEEAYSDYCRKLAVLQTVYSASASRKPKLPWEDDWYRDCNYSVDWTAGTWNVVEPELQKRPRLS